MSDLFSIYRAVAVMPHDTNTIPQTRGVYVGVAGDLAVKLPGSDTAVTFVGLAGGLVHPIQVVQVLDTGTAAESILALY